MIICIGPKSVGKTTLLRSLQKDTCFKGEAYEETFSTVPTVGMNIAKILLDKEKTILIHELGGSMAPIWPMHFKGSTSVIFVIDASNINQVSVASILLLDTLNNVLLQSCQVAVILNKTDINSSVQITELKYLLRLEEICYHAKQDIKIVETSCLTGKGIQDLKKWLSDSNK